MKMRNLIGSLTLVLTLVLAGVASRAQQPSATQGANASRIPPGINWPSPPLPDGPILAETGLQRNIRLTVTKGLEQPWSMAFLPDGGILVTERPGRLRIVRNGVLDPTPAAGIPPVPAQGLGGLMDLARHPRFRENRLIYFTYHKPSTNNTSKAGNTGKGGNTGVITLARGRWDGKALVEVRDLFSASQNNNASRIDFGRAAWRDRMLGTV
jgi:glucose/arabinose dehydrogenase